MGGKLRAKRVGLSQDLTKAGDHRNAHGRGGRRGIQNKTLKRTLGGSGQQNWRSIIFIILQMITCRCKIYLICWVMFFTRDSQKFARDSQKFGLKEEYGPE